MFEQFTSWYGSLDTSMQVFWGCAIVASVIFLIQMVLTMIGLDGHDVDVDFDVSDFGDVDADTMDAGGGLSLFSIRNLINFFIGFGWGGVCLSTAITNGFLLFLCAAVVGALFVWMFFLIKKQTKKLESNGAFNIKRCEGKTANVYLRIPGGNVGKGKVQISVNGAFHEVDAYTLESEPIASGARVRIVEVTDGQSVRVEKL